MLTAYCLGYGNWTVIPRQWKDCFHEMRDLGFDAVALSFSESEMRYARRTFAMQCETARAAGLKVFVIPSRIGGRLAGAPFMGSVFLDANPSIALPENPGVACVESEEFRQWSCDFLRTILRDYQPDGIVWDEPKESSFVTRHPAAVARYGENYSPEQAEEGFAELIGLWTNVVLEMIPEAIVTIFNLPMANPSFTLRTASLPGIAYAGFDGGLSLQSFFHEAPTKHKCYLWESWPRTVEECKKAGCGTFALIENMLMPRSEQDGFARNLEAFLEKVHPDHLACYYYAHNNESPDEVHSLVNDIVRRCYLNISPKRGLL